MPPGGWAVGTVVNIRGNPQGDIAILECFQGDKPTTTPVWNIYFSG
jgi:hypothetical protein